MTETEDNKNGKIYNIHRVEDLILQIIYNTLGNPQVHCNPHQIPRTVLTKLETDNLTFVRRYKDPEYNRIFQIKTTKLG